MIEKPSIQDLASQAASQLHTHAEVDGVLVLVMHQGESGCSVASKLPLDLMIATLVQLLGGLRSQQAAESRRLVELPATGLGKHLMKKG
jgi:hypothetical protein